MNLLTRLTTLAKADAHGVVDALEDKALVLRQHLRAAGIELERKKCRIKALAAEDQDLRRETESYRERIAVLEADVELALSEGQEELARYAIKKLLPLRHGVQRIERRLEVLAEEQTNLETRLNDQQAEYELLEQRVRGYLARQGDDDGVAAAYANQVVTEEDVEMELLRRRKGVA